MPHPSRPRSLSGRVAVMVGGAGRAGVPVLCGTGAVDACTYCISIYSLYSRAKLLSYRCSLFIRAARAWGTHLASKLAF